ncbi:MAG: hypothetical protein MI923_00725 [Phycisphaerales bacterium]|nr:hypothetical protein [Phycisphaerales bacterium]
MLCLGCAPIDAIPNPWRASPSGSESYIDLIQGPSLGGEVRLLRFTANPTSLLVFSRWLR